MKVRKYTPKDRKALKAIHKRAGYGFTFPKNLKSYYVVEDGTGEVIMAAGAALIPEITLICAPGGDTHPLLKLKGIALLHEELRGTLTRKGFHEAIASVPPSLVAYQRHLQRHFGWRESWKAFRIRDDWEGG